MDFSVKIIADLDVKDLQNKINNIQKQNIKIPVKFDIQDKDINKILSGIQKQTSKIKIDTDVTGVKQAESAIQGLKTSASQLSKFKFKFDTKGIDADLAKIESQINRFNQSAFTKGQTSQLNQIKASFSELKNVVSSFNGKDVLDESDLLSYNTALKTVQNQVKILSNELSGMVSFDDRITLSNKIQTWLNNNTKTTEEAKAELQSYINTLKNVDTDMSTGTFNNIRKGFSSTTSEMQALGKTGKSALDDFKRAFNQITQFAGAYGVIQNVIFDVPRQMWSAVRDVDDAMTSLQMATGVSNQQAKELMSTYAELGNQLKATSTDVAASGTEWLKQGQSIADSNKLAQSSIVLSKIGDLTSEEATSTITAAMKSYNIGVDGVMDFVDKISAIDMASATDVGGLATAFNEVAANARNAGVEADKLLSYAAVIGETTQESMASVGTSLNAIFSRMGNIKLSRLKDPETGEDLSNTETSLRNVGIELRETTGEFRDFDEVLDEVAANWNSYSEVEQRSIASSLAGTNHMNEILVLMQNYDQVGKLMTEAADSAGTSMQKYEAYTDSLAGKFCLYVQKCA